MGMMLVPILGGLDSYLKLAGNSVLVLDGDIEEAEGPGDGDHDLFRMLLTKGTRRNPTEEETITLLEDHRREGSGSTCCSALEEEDCDGRTRGPLLA